MGQRGHDAIRKRLHERNASNANHERLGNADAERHRDCHIDTDANPDRIRNHESARDGNANANPNRDRDCNVNLDTDRDRNVNRDRDADRD